MTDEEIVDRELLLNCRSPRAASTSMAMTRTAPP